MASPCCAGRGVNSPLLGRRGAEACLGSCSQAQSLSPTATLCAVSPGPRAPGSWGVRSQALPSALEALVVPGLRYLCALPAARPSPSRAGVSDPPPGDELRGYSCPVTSPGPGLSLGLGTTALRHPLAAPHHTHTLPHLCFPPSTYPVLTVLPRWPQSTLSPVSHTCTPNTHSHARTCPAARSPSGPCSHVPGATLESHTPRSLLPLPAPDVHPPHP